MINPATHSIANKRTVIIPIHECKLYMLGIGGVFKLCESKAACSAITVSINDPMCIPAWINFSVFFFPRRNVRYTKMLFPNRNIKPIVIRRGCQLCIFYFSSINIARFSRSKRKRLSVYILASNLLQYYSKGFCFILFVKYEIIYPLTYVELNIVPCKTFASLFVYKTSETQKIPDEIHFYYSAKA